MNRFGLGRAIPEEIKRAVRQRDGFGCVRCGVAIIEYEHFEPEFQEAREHTVDGIILLCVSCHALKTRGMLSKSAIEKARQNPKARQEGFSFGAFDIGDQAPNLIVGNIETINVPILFCIFGDENFRVDPPELLGGPFRISANVYDRQSREILVINQNEWQTNTRNWDVNVTGSKITIRSAIRDIALVIKSTPPDTLIFERILMTHRGVTIDSRPNRPTKIVLPNATVIETEGMVLNGCQKAFEITDNGFELGVGGGYMSMRNTTFNSGERSVRGNVIPFPYRPQSNDSGE